jgi:hypothetical protein
VARENWREEVTRGSATGATPWAVAARYDRQTRRILVLLSNGLQLAIHPMLAPALAHEKASDLEDVEISPAGLVLHWPNLDAEDYRPALLNGVFGTLEGRWAACWSEWPDKQPRQANGRRRCWK